MLWTIFFKNLYLFTISFNQAKHTKLAIIQFYKNLPESGFLCGIVYTVYISGIKIPYPLFDDKLKM